MTTQTEVLKMARVALGVQLDALLGKAGHLHNDDRRRYAENGIKAIDKALANNLKPRCFADFQPNHELDRKCKWCAVETECKTSVAQQSNEQVEPVAWTRKQFGEDREYCEKPFTTDWTPLYTHPPVPMAQPEQEPVAWRVSYPDEPELGFWFAEGIGGEGCLNEPLYTTPPQPKEPEQESVAITITGKLGNIYSFTGDYSLKKGDKVYTTTPTQQSCSQRTWVGLTFAEICECESEYLNVFARNIEAKLKAKNERKEKNT